MVTMKPLLVNIIGIQEMVATFIKIVGHSSDFIGFSIKTQGAKLWNKADNNLKTIQKVKQFKLHYNQICLKLYKKTNYGTPFIHIATPISINTS